MNHIVIFSLSLSLSLLFSLYLPLFPLSSLSLSLFPSLTSLPPSHSPSFILCLSFSPSYDHTHHKLSIPDVPLSYITLDILSPGRWCPLPGPGGTLSNVLLFMLEFKSSLSWQPFMMSTLAQSSAPTLLAYPSAVLPSASVMFTFSLYWRGRIAVIELLGQFYFLCYHIYFNTT